MAVFLSRSEEETVAFGREYAKTLKAGDTVCLEGELGAGKTALCRGILQGLGVKDEVTSPTYAYVNEYGNVFHFDCYRISSEAQAYALGLFDYFGRGGICLVEWAENIRGLIPENHKTLRITGRGVREISD